MQSALIRALAWGLLLLGWVALPAWVQSRTVEPLAPFVSLAGWMLLLGVMVTLLRRCMPHHAGLFDCTLPGWLGAGGQGGTPSWHLRIANGLMLPMMCSLWWMSDLCRGDALPPMGMVALHLAAMAVPAGLLRWFSPHRVPGWTANACAMSLGLGALAAVSGSGAWGSSRAWMAVALAHGVAWSLAWALLKDSATRLGCVADLAPWRTGLCHAGLVMVLGLLLVHGGPVSLLAIHAGLGVLAMLTWGAAKLLAHRTCA